MISDDRHPCLQMGIPAIELPHICESFRMANHGEFSRRIQAPKAAARKSVAWKRLVARAEGPRLVDQHRVDTEGIHCYEGSIDADVVHVHLRIEDVHRRLTAGVTPSLPQ